MQMKRIGMLLLLLFTLPPESRAQTGFDRRQVEREVIAVLDAFLEAFNRTDAPAEERTYQFPHYRLANGVMSVWSAPGKEIDAWMDVQNLARVRMGPQFVDSTPHRAYFGF